MNHRIQISIPAPCHKNWAAMTPTEKGRFCASCQKQVIDFTNASDREITTALRQDSNLCGRFNNTQLNRDLATTKERSSMWAAACATVISFFVLGSNKVIAQGFPIKTETSPQEKDVANDTIRKATVTTDNIKNILSGTIVDSMGFGLPGATVENISKNTKTSSDLDGKFSIEAETGDKILVSFVGFLSQKIICADKNDITIKLQENNTFEYVTVGMIIERRTFFGRIFHKIGNLFR